MQLHKRTSEPSPACLKINLATLCLQTGRIVTSHFLIYMTLNFYECMLSIHPKPPPAQTNSALRAHLRLSVDQQLPDRQAAASEAGKYIQHPYDQHWSVDFRRNPPALPPLTIINSSVTAVESFRFLGATISQDLKWDNNIESIVKKAQQRLYFLRQRRKFNLPQELLKQFYSAITESILCTSITVWFSSATKSDLRRLRRVVRSAERIIGTSLPTLQEL